MKITNDNYHKQTILYSFTLIPIFIWIGFVCSISFMEAWLKFRAPDVSLSAGLSIGRLIFATLNKVEWSLAGLLVILIFANRHRQKEGPKPEKSIFLYIPISILLLQTSLLLPSLNERAENIIQGMVVSPSFVHFYYLFFEIIKVLSLFILGIKIIYSGRKNDSRFFYEKTETEF